MLWLSVDWLCESCGFKGSRKKPRRLCVFSLRPEATGEEFCGDIQSWIRHCRLKGNSSQIDFQNIDSATSVAGTDEDDMDEKANRNKNKNNCSVCLRIKPKTVLTLCFKASSKRPPPRLFLSMFAFFCSRFPDQLSKDRAKINPV